MGAISAHFVFAGCSLGGRGVSGVSGVGGVNGVGRVGGVGTASEDGEVTFGGEGGVSLGLGTGAWVRGIDVG